MGLRYEEFIPGHVWRTAGRMIGESDIMAFAALSGDFSAIHVDEETARRGPFGARIAHGPLPMSVAIGLMTQLNLLEGTAVALLNLNWDFGGVVRIGDTIHALVSVKEKRPTRDPARGIVKLGFEAVTQTGETVQRGVNTVLVLTRAGASRDA